MKFFEILLIYNIKRLFPYSYGLFLKGSLWFYVPFNKISQFVIFLKKHSLLRFDILMDIFCVDYPLKKKRFELVYHFLSLVYNYRLNVMLLLSELHSPKTITDIYQGAFWLEREVWDMFGVNFLGHTDMRRILTDYGFKGHPLRKDFPMSGFVEVVYSDIKKKINYTPVSLVQSYRFFNHVN